VSTLGAKLIFLGFFLVTCSSDDESMTMAFSSSSDATALDFFLDFFLRLDFLGRGAGFSSSSDESGIGGVIFVGGDG
jgi:hypothetical protein